jgi:ammonium transporter, Amt family
MLARFFALVVVLLCTAAPALAADTTAPLPADPTAAHPELDSLNKGDTAWVLACAGLVMLMTPGLAFFYGGLVRKKNILSILMQCMAVLCLITLQWVAFGYSLSFGPDVGGVIGNLDWAFLNNVGAAPNETYAKTIPHTAFMIFQAMFAVITPGLILGAFAERMRFSAFCLFSLLWATLIYDPVCHWVWGSGGFLANMGVLDFAGGIVVHITAGVSALAAALYLGRRQGYPHSISPPHSLPLAVLGAGLLWFGWFGFNAGSALQANWIAASALVATHVAGAAAGFSWALLDWIFNKRPTMLGVITGAVAGLAAVTPASGFVSPLSAAAIGIIASIICWLAVTFLKNRFRYDDSLDAFGVHGIGGMWGVVATGLWASGAINWLTIKTPADGGILEGGGTHLVLVQLLAVVLVSVFAFVGSMILLKLVDLVAGLRVTEHEERVGLDLTQHRESGYTLVD